MQSSSPQQAARSLPQRCDCRALCQLGVSAPSRSPLLLPLTIRNPHSAQLELIYHLCFPWLRPREDCEAEGVATAGACFPNFPNFPTFQIFQKLEIDKRRPRGSGIVVLENLESYYRPIISTVEVKVWKKAPPL